MQIVIDIPDTTYVATCKGNMLPPDVENVVQGIKNGTPLDEVFNKIRAEIEQNAYPIVHGCNNHELGMTLYGILQIIDKYRTGSNETQTNEIVYDVGGHMYGAMGGDVIMDILAGKGNE